MAKAATKKDKKKKPAPSVTVRVKTKSKGEKKARKAAPSSDRRSAFESLAKLADHPMVADLLAAGAVAAVAAIAEQQLGKDRPASSKMVKSAGKAAAAAIGKKLMSEFGAIKDAAASAAKKA